MNILLKLSGVVLLISGLILTGTPDLFGKFPTAIDPYQMIEKRVKWGVLIGLGGFLIFYHNWTSPGLILTSFLTCLTFGIIMARVAGFVWDGFFIKQLYWLLIEVVAAMIFGFLYWKQIP